MSVEGETVAQEGETPEWVDPPSGRDSLKPDLDEPPRKLLVLEGVSVSIAHEVVYELGADGKPLRVTQYTAYTGEQVRTMFADPEALKVGWLDPRERKLIVQKLEERGVSLEQLENVMSGEEHDPLDLLCHLAFGAALLTRKERATAAREKSAAFLAQYSSAARAILEDLLEHYTHTGVESLESMTVFKVLPSSRHLKLGEVVRYFGGEAKLGEAMKVLEQAIYA